jgi:hypothetical protein
MPRYEVNDDGVKHARYLIGRGEFDADTEWSDAAPSSSDENEEIDEESFAEYARWHLAVDPDKGERTKGRYRFPYGDFDKVLRSALIHAKARAAQNDHTAIEKAADELLKILDEKRS